MADEFESFTTGLESPAEIHTALVADSNTDINPRPRSIYCAAGGTITVSDKNGTELPYTLVAGTWIPFRGTRITAISGGTFYGWS